jgi:hypothetical protein
MRHRIDWFPSTLRAASAAMLVCACATAAAQALPPALPPPPIPAAETVPDSVPPPAVAVDPELEPQVTIMRKEGETIEEARVNGRLVWIRVTPRHGKSYYLVPDASDGSLLRRDGFDPGLRVPMWVLFTF